MDLEIINKLYLELSQVATATTQKEIKLVAAARNVIEKRKCKYDWDDLKEAIASLEDELQKFS